MPILPAAKKSMRSDKKKQLRNKAVKSNLKTLVKRINELINQKKHGEASKFLKQVSSALDKSAKIGIIKKNTASRQKSRLCAKIAKISA